MNIPREVPVNYFLMLMANLSDSDEIIFESVFILNETETLIPLLFTECVTIELSLVARAAGSENSTSATLVETLCKLNCITLATLVSSKLIIRASKLRCSSP
jgi:hypothetical protein